MTKIYQNQIQFKLDDNFPLRKTLKLHNVATVIRFIFNNGNKYYPQVFLEGCL